MQRGKTQHKSVNRLDNTLKKNGDREKPSRSRNPRQQNKNAITPKIIKEKESEKIFEPEAGDFVHNILKTLTAASQGKEKQLLNKIIGLLEKEYNIKKLIRSKKENYPKDSEYLLEMFNFIKKQQRESADDLKILMGQKKLQKLNEQDTRQDLLRLYSLINSQTIKEVNMKKAQGIDIVYEISTKFEQQRKAIRLMSVGIEKLFLQLNSTKFSSNFDSPASDFMEKSLSSSGVNERSIRNMLAKISQKISQNKIAQSQSSSSSPNTEKLDRITSISQLIPTKPKNLVGTPSQSTPPQQLMHKILELQKQNLGLIKGMKQLQEQFEYIVEQKLILQSRLQNFQPSASLKSSKDESYSIFASRNQQKNQKHKDLTIILQIFHEKIRSFQQEKEMLKKIVYNEVRKTRMQFESIVSEFLQYMKSNGDYEEIIQKLQAMLTEKELQINKYLKKIGQDKQNMNNFMKKNQQEREDLQNKVSVYEKQVNLLKDQLKMKQFCIQQKIEIQIQTQNRIVSNSSQTEFHKQIAQSHCQTEQNRQFITVLCQTEKLQVPQNQNSSIITQDFESQTQKCLFMSFQCQTEQIREEKNQQTELTSISIDDMDMKIRDILGQNEDLIRTNEKMKERHVKTFMENQSLRNRLKLMEQQQENRRIFQNQHKTQQQEKQKKQNDQKIIQLQQKIEQLNRKIEKQREVNACLKQKIAQTEQNIKILQKQKQIKQQEWVKTKNQTIQQCGMLLERKSSQIDRVWEKVQMSKMEVQDLKSAIIRDQMHQNQKNNKIHEHQNTEKWKQKIGILKCKIKKIMKVNVEDFRGYADQIKKSLQEQKETFNSLKTQLEQSIQKMVQKMEQNDENKKIKTLNIQNGTVSYHKNQGSQRKIFQQQSTNTNILQLSLYSNLFHIDVYQEENDKSIKKQSPKIEGDSRQEKGQIMQMSQQEPQEFEISCKSSFLGDYVIKRSRDRQESMAIKKTQVSKRSVTSSDCERENPGLSWTNISYQDLIEESGFVDQITSLRQELDQCIQINKCLEEQIKTLQEREMQKIFDF